MSFVNLNCIPIQASLAEAEKAGPLVGIIPSAFRLVVSTGQFAAGAGCALCCIFPYAINICSRCASKACCTGSTLCDEKCCCCLCNPPEMTREDYTDLQSYDCIEQSNMLMTISLLGVSESLQNLLSLGTYAFIKDRCDRRTATVTPSQQTMS